MDNNKMFQTDSVGKVLVKTSIPAIITMLVMIVYNMADMFFIGQTGDAMQVAAVSLAGPVISILSGLGTLIGSGGCAAIAIELGRKNSTRVKAMSSFCCYACIAIGVFFAAVLWLGMEPILGWIGASESTAGYAGTYLGIIAAGAPCMLFASAFANVVRAEGAVRQSMLGNAIGSVVNIILDPIFILVLGMGVAGAAVATVLGNCVSLVYFMRYIHSKRSGLSLHPKHFSIKKDISVKILALGLPTSIGVMLMSISSIVRNNMMVQYGDMAIAAMGVAGKVTMVVTMLQMGICMGLQPVLAYNFGAANVGRMKALLKRTGQVTVVVGAALTLLVVLFRNPLVALFIRDGQVIALGQRMAIISVVSGPIFGLCYLSTTFFQATDKAGISLLISLLRQGVVLLPLCFLLNAAFGMTGLLYAQPIADVVATVTGVTLLGVTYRKTIGNSKSRQCGIV